MIVTDLEPVEEVKPEAVKDIIEFFSEGRKYILDPRTLKTQEDIIKVIKHFSTRVELTVLETKGIEQYVKQIGNNKTH